MSLGSSTTPGMAEYYGLVHGLQQAKDSGYRHLTVVGDGAMIITQFRLQRCPRQPLLATFYRTARCLANDVEVAYWSHQHRDFNTMAHFAATIAMETKHLLQVHAPSDRAIARTLQAYLHHDVNFWLETSHSIFVGTRSCRSRTACGRDSAANI